ncbi:BRO family protein [Hominenteromicrobium sp.]|uniref:BRO family protein n=1 Tax=Hominenteromicrobium sp. TaxID=3073581 RepID=UPI003A9483E5
MWQYERDWENEIRTVQQDGEPWFVLKDVCGVLGLTDTGRTAERLDSDELTRTTLVSGGQNREMLIVNESGLYNVILRSDKPEAKPFRKWVTGEVLSYEGKNKGLFEIKECVNEKNQWSGTQTLITLKGRETFRLLMIG